MGAIITVEHDPPVYTLGRREKEDEELVNRLNLLGAEVFKVSLTDFFCESLFFILMFIYKY